LFIELYSDLKGKGDAKELGKDFAEIIFYITEILLLNSSWLQSIVSYKGWEQLFLCVYVKLADEKQSFEKVQLNFNNLIEKILASLNIIKTIDSTEFVKSIFSTTCIQVLSEPKHSVSYFTLLQDSYFEKYNKRLQVFKYTDPHGIGFALVNYLATMNPKTKTDEKKISSVLFSLIKYVKNFQMYKRLGQDCNLIVILLESIIFRVTKQGNKYEEDSILPRAMVLLVFLCRDEQNLNSVVSHFLEIHRARIWCDNQETSWSLPENMRQRINGFVGLKNQGNSKYFKLIINS